MTKARRKKLRVSSESIILLSELWALTMTEISRHIIQEIQKENAAITHQKKLVEAENKMLMSETDKLREVRTCLCDSPGFF